MGWSETITTKDGATVIICGRGRRAQRQPCQTPGCRNDSVALCDHPVVRAGKKGTCDRRMCQAHRHPIGPNRDLCAPHFRGQQPRPPVEPLLAAGKKLP